ncbi:TetR family transcriptional regulator, partial [Actinomadura adrarensis]
MTGRAEQREQTRRTLLTESRRLFATRGYGAVGLAEIVRSAGVTKGALYHHF